MKVNQLSLHFITACCFIAGLASASAIKGAQYNEDRNMLVPSSPSTITDKCPSSSTIYSTYGNISKGKVAEQSSTCHTGDAARAVDGNTNGNWGHLVNRSSHTCKEDMNTWSVDVGPSIITKIVIWNRTDCGKYGTRFKCWGDRLKGAKLEIFNGKELLASKEVASTGSLFKYEFENIRGTVVKISLANEMLSLAEVEVFGHTFTQVYESGHACEGANQNKNLGTDFMTPKECLATAAKDSGCGSTSMWSWSLNTSKGCSCCVPGAIYTKHHNWDIYEQEPINLSKGKAAEQSSTCHGGDAARALDGNKDGNWEKRPVDKQIAGTQHWGTQTHTCKEDMNTWSVDVGPSIITKIVIWNRTDCKKEPFKCWGDRLKDAKLEIFNGKEVLASGNFASTKSVYNFEFENIRGTVVKISLANDWLSLAEVEVFGFAL